MEPRQTCVASDRIEIERFVEMEHDVLDRLLHGAGITASCSGLYRSSRRPFTGDVAHSARESTRGASAGLDLRCSFRDG
jgi:hypothetical protein